MLLARLAQAMGDEAVHCLILPATRIAKIFIWSDVCTFALQACGGGMSTSHSPDSQRIGPKVGLRTMCSCRYKLTRPPADHAGRPSDPARILHLLHRHSPHFRLPSPASPGVLAPAAAVHVQELQVLVVVADPRLATDLLCHRPHLHRHPRAERVPTHRVFARVLRLSGSA